MSDYPFTTWRLIRDGPTDGATNMAVDEAVLRSVSRGESLPMLRLYAWEPPCLSLGRGQALADVDRSAVDAEGYGLVRRPTGGRAILHIDELTYSVVTPRSDPRVAGSVVESYRRLSAALVRALEQLGVGQVAADQRVEDRDPAGPVCFEAPSDYEITAGGAKLLGSAQMRARGVVLQHGSLPLKGDIGRICPLLIGRPDPRRVRARATTVERALGRAVSWEEAADAVTEAFSEALSLRLKPSSLSRAEGAETRRLRTTKYATESWTEAI